MQTVSCLIWIQTLWHWWCDKMGYKRIHWVLIGSSCIKINRLTQKSCFEILRNQTKDSCALSLSFYHLLSKFANSLDPDDGRRFAGPDLGQTSMPIVNLAHVRSICVAWYTHISQRKENFRQVPQIYIFFKMHAVLRFIHVSTCSI